LTPTIEDTIRNYDNVYLVGSSLGVLIFMSWRAA
jgi:hypothetical protein